MATLDVDEADVLATIRWAQDQIGDQGLYAVALVGERDTGPQEHRRGLTWLGGMDVNDAALDDHQRHLVTRMEARQGKPVVLN